MSFMYLNDAYSANQEEVDALQKLHTEFKENIRAPGKSKYSFEFCPDNTCDLFVTKKIVPSKSFGDFIYLYLYFFSDYYFLSEWRAKQDVTSMMKTILSNRKYDRCHSSEDREKARCVVRYLSRSNRIKLYSVRYDEHRKSVLRKSIHKRSSRENNGLSPIYNSKKEVELFYPFK